MVLGYEVNSSVLNSKVAEAVIDLREAFENVETIAKWLTNHPNVEGSDPLTSAPFNYTADEAYALRVYFENFETVRIANAANFDIGRKMTGLE